MNRTEREERPERLKRPERLSRPLKQEREPRQERPSKPASVAIRDFEDSLERCINSSGLPPIIIEMVMMSMLGFREHRMRVLRHPVHRIGTGLVKRHRIE